MSTTENNNLTLDKLKEAIALLPGGLPVEPKIIVDRFLVKTHLVGRSWGERLLSWPWKPWVRTRMVESPDPNVYELPGGIYVCHPRTLPTGIVQ